MIHRTVVILLFFLASMFAGGQAKPDPLVTIGDHEISTEEFMRIYRKNNQSPPLTDPKSVEEYLELFINFKLKVIEAEARGLDTLASFRNELAGYRRQLAQPYLADASFNEALIREAWERSRLDISVSHILVRLDPYAGPGDTLSAHNRISTIRDRILRGEDFAEVARGTSDDPSARTNGGNLGFLSVFTTVYPFESMAYSTPVGEISPVFRTRSGYHILRVQQARKARGTIRVAHIMIALPAGSSPEAVADAEKRISEIHQKLMNGEDFSQLAENYSDDRNSGRNGGELPWFGVGRMVPEFEDAAFALKKDGETSAPVRTSFGFHIIKRLEHKPAGSLEEMRSELAEKIQREDRQEAGREHFIRKLRNEYGFEVFPGNLETLRRIVDSTVLTGKWDPEKARHLRATVYRFAGQTLSQYDLARHLAQSANRIMARPLDAFFRAAAMDFANQSLIDYEDTQLERKYPDFRYLVQEYHDGILLFDLMDRMVWSRAVQDTAGLKAFHEANKYKYMWEERMEASIYHLEPGLSPKKLEKAGKKMQRKQLPESYLYKQFGLTDDNNVYAEHGLFSFGENSLADTIPWMPGAYVITGTERDHLIVVHRIVPPTPKELSEARGMITSDYQLRLEKEWIRQLRDKYPVKVNPGILKTITQ